MESQKIFHASGGGIVTAFAPVLRKGGGFPYLPHCFLQWIINVEKTFILLEGFSQRELKGSMRFSLSEVIMNVKQLNRLLIEKFPELEKEYHEEVDWQEGDETGSHVVYGDVFAPYVEKIVMQQNNAEMRKVFAFIEEILLKDEKYSDEVIMFSVLEGLMLDKEQYESCKKYFGKCTKRAINEMQKF